MSGECFVRDIFQQERGFETYSSALLGIERDAVMWAEILRPLLESEVARLGPTLGEVLGVAETIKTKFAEFWARIQVSGEKPELLAATSDMTEALFLAICILGLEFAHSDPGFLVRSNAAFGWIALFSLPHQNLTLVGFSDATLSR